MMKKTFLIISLTGCSLAFGQANQNQSDGFLNNGFNNPPTLGQQFSGQEVFRFGAGIVTQLQDGSDFGFGNEWFGLGKSGLD
jgi:hypothetical protein